MAGTWWKEPAMADEAECAGSAAKRVWISACELLCAPDADTSWLQLADASPPDSVWHSLNNCVAYQANIWSEIMSVAAAGRGGGVSQPAAFRLALVLRHCAPDTAARLLARLLRGHPQSQDLTSYILALLTDDETGGHCAPGENSPTSPVPLRDLQLFGDCELAVLAAAADRYDAHAALVRNEYGDMSAERYYELRIRVLNQFSQIPKIFHTPEFEHLEKLARDNIQREIEELREKILTFQTT